jgi:UV excision repair protein RAD23
LIQPLLQQLGANNPQLAQLINQNPEALYQLLAGADDEEGDFDPAAFGGAEGEDPFGGQTVIQLTEQEAEAVRRVRAPIHKHFVSKLMISLPFSWSLWALTDSPF